MSKQIYWEFPKDAPILAGEKLPITFTDDEFSTVKTAVEQSGVDTAQFALKADAWAEANKDIREQVLERYKPKLARCRNPKGSEPHREMWQEILKKRIMAFAEFLTGETPAFVGGGPA